MAVNYQVECEDGQQPTPHAPRRCTDVEDAVARTLRDGRLFSRIKKAKKPGDVGARARARPVFCRGGQL